MSVLRCHSLGSSPPFHFEVTLKVNARQRNERSLNFIFHRLSVCQGPYDVSLIRAWEEWDTKHVSENDHPKEFPEKQVDFSFIFFIFSCA